MDQPEPVTIFVLSHSQDLLNLVPSDSRLKPTYLPHLPIGRFQHNNLGEGRAFLMEYGDAETTCLGFANARWNFKYPSLMTKLQNLPDYVTAMWHPGLVLAPWLANRPGESWLDLTLAYHPTMERLLYELADFTGFDLRTNTVSLWANDFVCSRSVLLEWQHYWRKCFYYFFGKYGFDIPFAGEGTDPSRTPAFFYERFTALYFANRRDLNVVPVL